MTRIKSARKEDIKESTKNNVKNFLLMGLDIEMIAKGTGLSVEEV
jgi:hypothetical protein